MPGRSLPSRLPRYYDRFRSPDAHHFAIDSQDPKDLFLGIATLYFGFTIRNAVWIVVSAALFHTRSIEEASLSSPSTKATLLEVVGISEKRKMIGNNRLRAVLLGYDEAVTQTLYLPLGLCAATIVESVFSEWQSVKKKHA
ncbi:hypothetical protein BKA67DRAFT_537450 [Truncatella angustata]|uniref:Uncharacterized protein n=1 Tax=Truncatella angustata TaxID=152316 RepID=A0A9P8ZU60_9PEZI|nr:uncharacterized protein BKA67DRAFT_537450 [Truncatella angustata]KAH6651584.1 hypothetical protein BKA67DRAFT_537450 [Truncatella angustata]